MLGIPLLEKLCWFLGFRFLGVVGFLFQSFLVSWVRSVLVSWFQSCKKLFNVLLEDIGAILPCVWIASGFISEIFKNLLGESAGFVGARLFQPFHFWISNILKFARTAFFQNDLGSS